MSQFARDTLWRGIVNIKPKVDFAKLTDEEIAQHGLNAGQAAFERDVADGFTNGDSLAMVVGGVDSRSPMWRELGRREIGPDAAQFFENIGATDGKLATALTYQTESVAALQAHGDDIPAGPQRYTGGVYYTARVLTRERGWMTRNFAGAASGVQGHFDMKATYAALTTMGALWALKMQALHGHPGLSGYNVTASPHRLLARKG